MSSWWDQLDDDRSNDEKKATRLARVITRLAGDQAEKVRFLTVQMALMEGEAEREGHVPGSRRFGGAMKSIAFRYWRQELKRKSQTWGPGEKQYPGETAASKPTREDWKHMGAEFRKARKEAGV